MKRLAEKLLAFINRVEDWFLIILLAVMVVLAITQIFYRNLFAEGIVWIDPFLRILVLWVAISGAVVASRTNNHIRIDFFTRYFTKSTSKIIQRLAYAFSAYICGLIAWHAARFVRMEHEYQTVAFADIPAWLTELIIPLGFFLMALRYLILFIMSPEQRDGG